MKNFTRIILALLLLTCLAYGDALRFDVIRKNSRATMSDEVAVQDIKNALGISDDSDQYSSVAVFVMDGYYIAMLFSATSYESFQFKVEKKRNGSYDVIENYDAETVNSLDPDFCATCPDETVEIVLGGSFSDPNHVSRQYVTKAYNDLTALGLKVVKLEGSQENAESVSNWLACKNVKLYGRIGHGDYNSISFAGQRAGSLSASQIGAMDIEGKIFILNCCYFHNSGTIPSIVTNGKAKFFAAGNAQMLEMYKSEPVWHQVLLGAIRDSREFGQLIDEGNPKLGASNKYGYTRRSDLSGGVFWESAKTIELSTPNGGEEYEATQTVTIEWECTAEDNVSIYLLKGSSTVKTIASGISNTGSYSWTIPEDLDDGDDYKLKVTCGDIEDISDESFTITTPRVVTLKSPGSGDEFEAEETMTIKWETNSTEDEVSIYLLKDGEEELTIAEYVDNSGSYKWEIPEDIEDGDDYSIRISIPNGDGTIEDETEEFSIMAVRVITLKSPIEEDEFKGGEKMSIKWETNCKDEEVVLYLMKDGDVEEIIADDAENTGKYVWEIPEDIETGDDYSIKIDIDGITAESDEFTIKKATAIKGFNKQITSYGIKQIGAQITYQIPGYHANALVSVKLFDQKGRLVRTFVNTNQSSGVYMINLSKANLAAGHYIVSMKAANYTKNMAIVYTR